jgi:hypothetical protein
MILKGNDYSPLMCKQESNLRIFGKLYKLVLKKNFLNGKNPDVEIEKFVKLNYDDGKYL